MPNEELDFKIEESWKKAKERCPWMAHVPEFANDLEGNLFMRDSIRKVVYKVTKKDGNNLEFACNTCGSEIHGARIAHPIWDGLFPCSGSGECQYETVPYCPVCEKQPSYHGAPIQESR